MKPLTKESIIKFAEEHDKTLDLKLFFKEFEVKSVNEMIQAHTVLMGMKDKFLPTEEPYKVRLK